MVDDARVTPLRLTAYMSDTRLVRFLSGLTVDRLSASFSSAWRALKHLTTLGYPKRFPIVQFPNLPLIIGVTSGHLGRYVHGVGYGYLRAAGYLAMTIWAYEELVRGTNWFRRLLGLTYVVILFIRLAHGLRR
jgi:hypothetical protein